MRLVFVLAMLSCAVHAGPKLYLKTRIVDTADRDPSLRTKQGREADAPSQVHLLIQYGHAPEQADIDALVKRDVTVNGYLHENGLSVTVADPAQLDGLPLTWISQLEAADKISPLLVEGGGSLAVLIEFHPDIDIVDGRRLVVEAGLTLVDHPDLSSHHILAVGEFEQIARLTHRDEVSYVFPAPAELLSGEPLIACASALTATGATGQYAAKVSEGWDGPGKGTATLGYFFQNITAQLPADAARAEIVRALNEWSRPVQINFKPGTSGTALRTINILFASREHGDQYAFDGPWGALAHTFYPAPPNPEPLAGDLHFDDDEPWRIGAATDLFSVALHELGHALGLGHSDRPGTVMYPYYSRWAALTADDITAIQELYAERGGLSPTGLPPTPETPAPPQTESFALYVQPPPPVVVSESIVLLGSTSGGIMPVILVWRTDRGHTGLVSGNSTWSVEIPLETGTNRITLTASDGRGNSSVKTVTVERGQPTAPISLQITYPATSAAFTVTQANITLRGTAAHASGIRRVAWSNDRGGGANANGTLSWDTGPIALQTGTNLITVSALAGDGSIATRVIEVRYGAAARDSTAPTLTISSPASPTYSTSAESIVLRGTAKDNIGVTEVAWFSSTGPSGQASGTTSWTTPAIPLMKGVNSIVVRAFDAAGNMSWRSVNVTRQ